MQTLSRPQTTPENLADDQIEYYRENGFVRGIISEDEAAHFRAAALEYSARARKHSDSYASAIFDQMVNAWREDDAMKKLTLHANVAAIAEKLAGVSLKLWHDQILIKQAGKSRATEFHQDQPYWPHAASTHPISCWIALGDVPVECGCMTFIPRSHRKIDLPAQQLADEKSLFSIAPDLQWEERITVPLRAGDCTFHHGRCAHMATPNLTEEARVAHVVIFIDASTRYIEKPHVVTDALDLKSGEILGGEILGGEILGGEILGGEMFPATTEFQRRM